MPLEHSSSPAAFKRNVSTLMGEVGKSPHVQSREQALAIAYATKRRGRADGGVVGYDNGGGVDPVNAVINALQQGATSGGGSMAAPGTSNPSAPSSATSTVAQNSATGIAPLATMTNAPATQMPVPQVGNPSATTPAANVNTQLAQLVQGSGVANKAGGGGFNMSSGPSLTAPWTERQEARGLHVGPVLSSVPGRTDNHQVKVPAGSYVLPAQHVASMGQGNSNAGLSIASKMFGGPYGTSAMRMGGGHSMMPHPPKAFTNFSEGGARGTDSGMELVPVNISGGEYVVPPQAIIKRYGSLKAGHAILDKWVMDTRKKEIETQKKLPPPATK
jgi:hypothetical protein